MRALAGGGVVKLTYANPFKAARLPKSRFAEPVGTMELLNEVVLVNIFRDA